MKKTTLNLDSLHVASFATQETPDWQGTVLAHQITANAAQCTTKTMGCPITWGCPYTTP